LYTLCKYYNTIFYSKTLLFGRLVGLIQTIESVFKICILKLRHSTTTLYFLTTTVIPSKHRIIKDTRENMQG
jgi:hypothetical protein